MTIKDLKLLLKDGYPPLRLADLLDIAFTEVAPTPAQVGLIKDYVQKQALETVKANGGWGLCAMATGTGKSKVAIDFIKEVYAVDKTAIFAIIVPTEKLRDENWKEEFEKWGALEIWENNVERYCYASANKVRDKRFAIAVLDEGHNITEANSEFFTQNNIDNCIALSATPPTKVEKVALLKDLNLLPVYVLPLDIAVKLRIVAPYEIIIVESKLDNVNQNIQAGSKLKPFKQTEEKAYAYLTQQVNRAMYSSDPRAKAASKWKLLARMRFIYDLPSKTRAAQRILDLLPREDRILIFCGGIDQAEQLADTYSDGVLDAIEDPITFHSQCGDKWFNAFKAKVINRLTCVNSLNEGHTIDDLDTALVVQLNSNELSLIQRIGRIVRFRPGHVAKIIILCCVGTKDEDWVRKAMGSLDATKVKYTRIENVINGSFIL